MPRAPVRPYLTLIKDAKNGLLVSRQGGQDFGIVHVHAWDRGLALFIDRYSRNQENVMRVGTIVAAKRRAWRSSFRPTGRTWACA